MPGGNLWGAGGQSVSYDPIKNGKCGFDGMGAGNLDACATATEVKAFLSKPAVVQVKVGSAGGADNYAATLGGKGNELFEVVSGESEIKVRSTKVADFVKLMNLGVSEGEALFARGATIVASCCTRGSGDYECSLKQYCLDTTRSDSERDSGETWADGDAFVAALTASKHEYLAVKVPQRAAFIAGPGADLYTLDLSDQSKLDSLTLTETASGAGTWQVTTQAEHAVRKLVRVSGTILKKFGSTEDESGMTDIDASAYPVASSEVYEDSMVQVDVASGQDTAIGGMQFEKFVQYGSRFGEVTSTGANGVAATRGNGSAVDLAGAIVGGCGRRRALRALGQR